MRRRRISFLAIILLAAALSCANPMAEGETAPADVETIVAGTLQALTASAPQGTPAGMLPYSMYFLGDDDLGLLQVYRLEKDGMAVTQITFEPANVQSYDVSLLDGSLAYVSNNQLLLVNADGGNRRVLLDGGPRDENNPYLANISSPVFSPDQQTIAYGAGGLNFYSLTTGRSERVLENKLEDMGSGTIIPLALYRPRKYSTDGTKLVIDISHFEGGTAALYSLNDNTLIMPHDDKGSILICCSDIEWTADGSAFYAASPISGIIEAGLWRVDAPSGEVTSLFTGSAYADPANLANEPFPAPDGQLYFFFASVPNPDLNEFLDVPPLQLVRSALDGVTNRTVLRPETFRSINEVLWAPDASFVIVSLAPNQDDYRDSAVQLVYTDGGKSIVPLVPSAMQMKWGP